jgi:hypothetical protein
MNKRQIVLAVVALVLLAGLAYLSRDWFAKPGIQIGHTIRANRVPERYRERLGPAIKQQTHTVSFFFSRKCELKSIKVLSTAEMETNKYPHPLWELVADSNSVSTKTITYGIPVRGMRPTVKGATADLLRPATTYRLLLEGEDTEGNRFTAEHDFKITR